MFYTCRWNVSEGPGTIQPYFANHVCSHSALMQGIGLESYRLSWPGWRLSPSFEVHILADIRSPTRDAAMVNNGWLR